MKSRLQISKSVVLDGSGVGSILFPSIRTHRKWEIERATVTVTGGSGGNLGGKALIYKGTIADSNFVDGTETPWTDVSEYSGGELEIFSGVQLRALFSGCGAGETATVRIEGWETDV